MFELVATWSDPTGLAILMAVIGALVFLYYVKDEIKGFLANANMLRVQVPVAGEVEMTSQREGTSGSEEEPAAPEGVSYGAPNEEPRKPKAEISSLPDDEETSKDKLRVRMGDALAAKDEEKAEAVFKRLQRLEDDPVQQKVDEGFRLWFRFIFKFEPDALEKLEELAKDERVAAQMYMFRGYCLQQAGDSPSAAVEFKRARDTAQDLEQKAKAVVFYAQELNKAGDDVQAVSELEEALKEFKSPKLRANLWDALATVYEKQGKNELRALALQKVLEIVPDDARLRFNVAYAYSNADESDFGPVVIHHYKTALRFDPTHETARNNLGVSYNRADMHILSAEALCRASEDGSGLATGNLAYRYLNAGFADEAEELVKQATQDGTPSHAKVAEASADIIKRREEEAEKRARLSALGQRQAAFLSEYAEARIKPAATFAGKWRFQDEGHEVEISEGYTDIQGTWAARKKPWKLEGPTYGRAARLVVSEMEYSYFDSAKEKGFAKRLDAYAYITAGGSSIEMMEVKDGEVGFRTLQRVRQQADDAS